VNPLVAQAAAPIAPNLKCTHIGQTVIWRNKKYTCVKSGKKLVWNKGVVIPKPKPSTVHSTKTSQPTTSPRATYTPALEEFEVAKSVNLKLNQPMAVTNFSLNYPSRGYILIRREDGVVAFTNRCSHEGAEVEISNGSLVCFRHLSYFDAVSGAPTSGPALRRLTQFSVIEREGYVFVIDLP
jgi:nitrite reductase/ring-hydroxylating ferredoxin subunit